MNKKLVILVLIGIFALGGTVSAYAATNNSHSQTPSTKVSEQPTAVEQDETVALPNGGIDQATAEQKAQGSVPGSAVSSSQLEDENGVIVYGVEIQKDGIKYDVKVDATSGAILKTDQDNDKESMKSEEKSSNQADNDNVQHENENEDPAGHEDPGQN